MPKLSLMAMSIILTAGILIGMSLMSWYAAESTDIVPAEPLRSGLRLQLCLVFILAIATASMWFTKEGAR